MHKKKSHKPRLNDIWYWRYVTRTWKVCSLLQRHKMCARGISKKTSKTKRGTVLLAYDIIWHCSSSSLYVQKLPIEPCRTLWVYDIVWLCVCVCPILSGCLCRFSLTPWGCTAAETFHCHSLPAFDSLSPSSTTSCISVISSGTLWSWALENRIAFSTFQPW